MKSFVRQFLDERLREFEKKLAHDLKSRYGLEYGTLKARVTLKWQVSAPEIEKIEGKRRPRERLKLAGVDVTQEMIDRALELKMPASARKILNIFRANGNEPEVLARRVTWMQINVTGQVLRKAGVPFTIRNVNPYSREGTFFDHKYRLFRVEPPG